MISENEKKLVSMFKVFMQRAIVPHIRTNQTAMGDWQVFSSLISQDSLDHDKLRSFLDSKLTSPSIKMFPASSSSNNNNNQNNPGVVGNGLNSSRRDLGGNQLKLQPQTQQPGNPSSRYLNSNNNNGSINAPTNPGSQSTDSLPVYAFNMNKTFGGERSKFGMFPIRNPNSRDSNDLQSSLSHNMNNSTNFNSQNGAASSTSSSSSGFDKILRNMELLQQSFRNNQQMFEQGNAKLGVANGVAVVRDTTRF